MSQGPSKIPLTTQRATAQTFLFPEESKQQQARESPSGNVQSTRGFRTHGFLTGIRFLIYRVQRRRGRWRHRPVAWLGDSLSTPVLQCRARGRRAAPTRLPLLRVHREHAVLCRNAQKKLARPVLYGWAGSTF